MLFACDDEILPTKNKPKKKIKLDPLDLIESINALSKEEIINLEGIGEKVGTSISVWFANKNNQKLLKKFYKNGVKFFVEEPGKGKKGVIGKNFVLTGSMGIMPRSQAKEVIKEAGGKVQSQVSGNTDYLVAGENAGSKLKKAKELDVKIIDEKTFLEMVD